MTIRYVFGDATRPQGEGHKIIVHVCNDAGGWGKGFVVSVSKRWAQPEQVYREAARAGPGGLALGYVQLVPVATDVTVANMIAQHGFGTDSRPPIRYDSVRDCLRKIADFYTVPAKADRSGPYSLHMPRIGCGLAGGDWHVIERIIEDEACLRGLPVTVYDLGRPDRLE